MRFLLILLFFLPRLVLSQEYYADWGPETRSSSQIIDVFPDYGTNFYTYSLSNSQLLQAPRVTHYVNGFPETTKRIAQRVENNIVTLEELVVFNGILLGFLSDKKDGMNSLYMVKYDSEIDPFGEPQVINSYPLPKSWANRGSFNILTSRNKRFLCVEYIIPGKHDLFDRYGYKVMDTAFNVVTEGEYELPYNSRTASVDLRYLTDRGDYLLALSVYNNLRAGLFKDYNSLEKTVVVHVSGNELSQYELNIEGKRVFDIGMNSLDSILIVTGTYGEPFSSGSQGVFVQRINLVQQQVVHDSFREFPREFMTQEMTQNQLDRLERREMNGRPGPELYNYAIRSIHPVEDGSTIVVAEQFYIYQQNMTDSRGITQTIYHYYFNDIIAYRIESDGAFGWITRIPKEQHSVNDNGYYSSVKTVVSHGRLLCFFNDNGKNYDELRNYEDFYYSVNFPVRKKSYVLAMAQVDIATGDVKRTVFNDYEESGGYVVLQLSPIDYHNHQLLLYAQGRRNRFGVVQF